jgi:predicted nucleic acid-binding protein
VRETQPAEFPVTLHRGEREAIVLAQILSADVLLIDEQVGRTIALDRNLPLSGTLGVYESEGITWAMIVIADSSPLHYFTLLEHAEVLQNLYGRVIVPEAVVRELMAQKAPDTVRRWITVPPDWLEVRKVTVLSDPALEKLDEGEREAIALAEEL